MKPVIFLIYFIYSSDVSWVEQAIQKKAKMLNSLDLQPIVFSGSFSVDELMLEVDMKSLFDSKKFIIVRNMIGFNTAKVLADDQYKKIEFLLKEPPKDVDIVFTLDGNKPDGKRKLTKLFKKHSDYTIHEGLDTQDINGLLQQLIHQNQLQLSAEAQRLLARFCVTQTDVVAAINKLKLIEGTIDESLVIKLVSDQRESMIYELSEALLKRDSSKVLSIYETLMKQNYQPIQLLYHLSNKYRQYYQLFTLHRLQESPVEIARQLKMSDRQAYFIINNHQNLISPKDCLRYLSSLAQLDQDAKAGLIDFKLGLELFLVKVLS